MNFFTQQGRALLLAAAVMFAAATPTAVYAQFGALGNMAKGKALEVLSDKVMKELEKKFAETVAKEPISEAAKEAVVKKLVDIARPIVKKFIDGAASGKLPNPLEVAQTVMKDILPRIPEIVAASKMEGGGGAAVAAAQGGQAYEAGQEQPTQQTQEKPKIAVYVVGDIPDNEKKILGKYLLTAFINSGNSESAENSGEFLAAVSEEQAKRGGVSKGLICELGRQFNIRYICAASVTSAFGFFEITARMVDAETEEIIFKGEAQSPLKTIEDLTQASNKIVEDMFGAQTEPELKSVRSAERATDASPPVYAPPPQIIATYPEVQPGYQTNPYGYPQQQGAVENFTGGERFGTWALNTVIPGLGSASIMRDWTGFGTQVALGSLGGTLLGLGVADAEALAIIGGVALAANVTYNIVRSATYRKPGYVPEPKVRKIDYYLSPKYQLPVGTPVSWGGANLEGGLVWGNGAFFGLDLNFGLSFDDDGYGYNEQVGFLIGGGLSLGNVVDLGNSLQFVYGMSAGFWYLENEENWERSVWHEGSYDDYYGYGYYYTTDHGSTRQVSVNFLAPFVKLRWSFLEVTYRGLLGIDALGGGFGWNNHQLMLGFYFATSKRERSR
ncbi:hypothetical protein R80B4_02097 [Fibrobacteres bacterium R8-0-B4]